MEDLLRTVPMSASDLLDDYFENSALKGVLGAAGILHKVRIEARREGRFSVPSIDLGELEKDFPRSPWVEEVKQIERA